MDASLIEKLGFPVAVTIALFIAIFKVLLPSMMKRLDDQDKERREILEPIRDSLAAISREFQDMRQHSPRQPAKRGTRK